MSNVRQIRTLGIMMFVIITATFFLYAHSVSAAVNLQYPDFVQNDATPAQFVARAYSYALYIAGTLAVLMIVYGGVKHVTSGGSMSAQKDALDIIKNAVLGILLLAGAYLILNTINPELVKLKDLTLPTVSIKEDPFKYTPTIPNPDGEVKNFAKSLIESGVNFSSSASCKAGSDPRTIISTIADGKYPLVCSNGCSKSSGCDEGGEDHNITLSKSMLTALMELRALAEAEQKGNFTVTSFTGGSHSPTSYHYKGRAVDIVPDASYNSNLSLNEKKAIWQWYKDQLYNLKARTEIGFDINGDFKDVSEMFTSSGSKKDGAHIHAAW